MTFKELAGLSQVCTELKLFVDPNSQFITTDEGKGGQMKIVWFDIANKETVSLSHSLTQLVAIHKTQLKVGTDEFATKYEKMDCVHLFKDIKHEIMDCLFKPIQMIHQF